MSIDTIVLEASCEGWMDALDPDAVLNFTRDPPPWLPSLPPVT